jgi:hypothetical protein
MILTLGAFAAIGIALELLAWVARKFTAKAESSTLRRAGLAAAVILGIVGLPFAAFAAYLGSYLVLGQPGPEDHMLGEGVRYRRRVFEEPRRIVVHILEVDLSRGSRILVSPPSVGSKNEAITATTAIDRLKADAVVNANFFYPFRESNPFDYSPREGELVQSLGEAIGQGKKYGQVAGEWVAFWSDPDGRVGFGEPPAVADAAVAGIGWLVKKGQDVVKDPDKPYPRTALALNKGRNRLWLVVVDGKQPRYSMGMTLRELSRFLVQLGVEDAIQLDGGGSSTLAARDGAGSAVLLSRPCHTKVPGRQRPVANFLGVVFPR